MIERLVSIPVPMAMRDVLAILAALEASISESLSVGVYENEIVVEREVIE